MRLIYAFLFLLISPILVVFIGACAFIGISLLIGTIMFFFLVTMFENISNKHYLLDSLYDNFEEFIYRMKNRINSIYGR